MIKLTTVGVGIPVAHCAIPPRQLRLVERGHARGRRAGNFVDVRRKIKGPKKGSRILARRATQENCLWLVKAGQSQRLAKLNPSQSWPIAIRYGRNPPPPWSRQVSDRPWWPQSRADNGEIDFIFCGTDAIRSILLPFMAWNEEMNGDQVRQSSID